MRHSPHPRKGFLKWHASLGDVDISPLTLLTFTYIILRAIYSLVSRTRLKWKAKARVKIADPDIVIKKKSVLEGTRNVCCQCGKSKKQFVKWKPTCQAVAIVEPPPHPEPTQSGIEETVDPKDAWKPSDFEGELAKYAAQVATEKKRKADELLLDLSERHETMVRDCNLPCCANRFFERGEFDEMALVQKSRDNDGINLSDIESRLAKAPRGRPPRARRKIQDRGIKCAEDGCGKVFDHIYQYNHHSRCHRKPHSCPHCELSFSLGKDLSRHVNAVHETATVYYCKSPDCKYGRNSVEGNFFKRKDHWMRHMRNQHSLIQTNEEDEDGEMGEVELGE